MQREPRSILAPNASPMTMGGTITYLVGERQVAIIDPGSAAVSHLDAILTAAGDADAATILVTHDHPDHAAGAPELAALLDAPVLAPGDGSLRDHQVVPTDHGELVALDTPGHAPHHASLHWPAADAIFCGDLMMGGIDTAVVAAPEGDVGAYLDSLERLRALAPRTIYPAHGPAFTDPLAALDRYVRHRAERQEQVLAAVHAGARTAGEIADRVYGAALEPALRSFALAAVRAYVQHLRATGRLTATEDVTS
jgi:glyoxylase-like metal-dependent hydrolase (beta-lactamase superfamily II)